MHTDLNKHGILSGYLKYNKCCILLRANIQHLANIDALILGWYWVDIRTDISIIYSLIKHYKNVHIHKKAINHRKFCVKFKFKLHLEFVWTRYKNVYMYIELWHDRDWFNDSFIYPFHIPITLLPECRVIHGVEYPDSC